MAALKAETAKWSTEGRRQRPLFGKTKASNELVGAATLFVKKGKEYVRVATTVKKDNGEPYYWDAKVFGKTYDTGYEPIKDASGAVIGACFVGEPK
jgi:methyl-accepting chemotaxis protein